MASSDWERGKSTMHKALYRFCDVVIERMRGLVRFPTGQEAIKSAKEMQKLSYIPNVVGVVDGTHTGINRPKYD